MPWVASRRDVEDFPVGGPGNCRVIVFDCISYSVLYMRILTIDEDRRVALTQESASHCCFDMVNALTSASPVFYNTSFRGIRGIGYDNDGYVLVEGLTGRLGPVSLGCMYSRLWFQTKNGKLFHIIISPHTEGRYYRRSFLSYRGRRILCAFGGRSEEE